MLSAFCMFGIPSSSPPPGFLLGLFVLVHSVLFCASSFYVVVLPPMSSFLPLPCCALLCKTWVAKQGEHRSNKGSLSARAGGANVGSHREHETKSALKLFREQGELNHPRKLGSVDSWHARWIAVVPLEGRGRHSLFFEGIVLPDSNLRLRFSFSNHLGA